MLNNNNNTVNNQRVNRMGTISQYHNTIPFYKGDFQYLENNLKKLETLNDIYDYYDIDLDKETNEIDEKQSHIQSDEYSDSLVDTYWNKNYKKSEEHSYPYRGYQDPNAIDWSVYGPDRPGKKKPPAQESSFLSIVSSETQIMTIFSFFGLLLPGILGTLYFLGVPLSQVYLAGISLVTMYFLTGEGKSLEDESLTTDVLMNVLQLIDAITKIAETN